MRLHEPSLCQDPSLRQELASLARGCDFVLPSRFKKRLKAFQQVQVQTKEEPLPPASSQSIPTFYFPRGRPQGTVNVDAVIAKIERTFAQFPHERATMEDMGKVAKGGRQILRPALPVQPGSDCFASFIPCQPTYGCTERPHLHLLNY
nr:serine/threonine-protein phosphatase 2A regulatory subunit B'' subunit beta-like isoform X5 [Equus asinus]